MHERQPQHTEPQPDQPAAETETPTPETTEPPYDRPQIWVGSWLDYTNGILHGQWIDAARGEATIWADIQTMLAASPTATKTGDLAEEWGIFDHENFGPLRIGEQESLDWIAAVGQGIARHGPAFAAWADVVQDQALLSGFADAYVGTYASVQAYAEDLIEDHGYDKLLDRALPDSIRRYARIDAAALGRDMTLNGDLYQYANPDGGVWLFHAI